MSRRRRKYRMLSEEPKSLEPTHFEKFVMKCCKMDEWDLRVFAKKLLLGAGFKVLEDDYQSVRGGRFGEVHNMLAIRGDRPKVCIVSHTDVVRDFSFRGRIRSNPDPVVKEFVRFGEKYRILQDRYNKTQIGGDDRLGVALGLLICLNSGYDMGLLLTTEEESGALSAHECNFDELMDFELLLQLDRGNARDQIVSRIGGVELCDHKMAMRLQNISIDIGYPRELTSGLLTDVMALIGDGKAKQAINCTIGYANNHADDEFIYVKKAEEALKFASAVVKDFEMETIDALVDNHAKSINDAFESMTT